VQAKEPRFHQDHTHEYYKFREETDSVHYRPPADPECYCLVFAVVVLLTPVLRMRIHQSVFIVSYSHNVT
jgi:hypothetical protein